MSSTVSNKIGLAAAKLSKELNMNVDKAVLIFAGIVILTGLTLGSFVSPYWYLLVAFAGLNMFQAGFTGFCPAFGRSDHAVF